MKFNIRDVAYGYATTTVAVDGVTIDLGMLNSKERVVLAEQLREAAMDLDPTYRHPAQLACEAAMDVIYEADAPLGSKESAEIQEILIKGAR